jgi:DNA-binding response OmpR family regulator
VVSVPSPVSTARRLSFGSFEADLHSGELRKNGVKVRLQAQPFQLLVMLLERPGELVTREGRGSLFRVELPLATINRSQSRDG